MQFSQRWFWTVRLPRSTPPDQLPKRNAERSKRGATWCWSCERLQPKRRWINSHNDWKKCPGNKGRSQAQGRSDTQLGTGSQLMFCQPSRDGVTLPGDSIPRKHRRLDGPQACCMVQRGHAVWRARHGAAAKDWRDEHHLSALSSFGLEVSYGGGFGKTIDWDRSMHASRPC